MTMPALTSAYSIHQRGAVSASPQAVADRIDLLHQNGHEWMPPDTSMTLASSDHSDTELLSIAGSIKSSLAQNWNGFTEAFDDTVLHKEPSKALALARYLHASLGPLPVREDDLHVIQTNLQRAGFGADLDISGVWDSGWNSAYNEWADNLRTRQLAGDRPGSTSTAHAGHSIFSALLPTHAINAIVGFAKAIPGEARTLAADLASGAGFLLRGPFGSMDEAKRHVQDTQLAVEHGLGNEDLTRQELDTHGVDRLVGDVGLVLMLVPVAGEASAAARVSRGAWEGGVSREFAERTTGTIAKSFLGGRTEQMIAEGTARRGLLNTRMFSNIPLLKQVGPQVGRLYDADGLYYKARTLLAAPYALPQVRVAGALGQRYMIGGAAINLAADAESALGIDNEFTRNVQNTNVIDDVDLAVGKVFGNPESHVFSHAVDALGFVLHGPLGTTANSTAVGDKVEALRQGMNTLIGNYGVEGSWQRAVSTATNGQHVPVTDLHAAFGDEELFHRFMANKLADLAAAHHAQRQAVREGLEFGGSNAEAYRSRVGELADEVWNNPDLHTQALDELLRNRQELENRIAADMIHNRLHPSEYVDGAVDDIAGSGDLGNYAANGIAWMNAGSHVQHLLTSGLARHLFGADGRAIIANAQDAIDFGGDVATATRVSTMTRREYVRQTNDLLDKVRRQVNSARTAAGKQTARYETELAQTTDPERVRSLRGKLQSTKQMQTMLEQALDSGELHKFTDLAKKFALDRKTARQWDHLVRDAARLRLLVDQATETSEGRLTLQHIIEQGVDPDELYTRVNGPARHDARIGSGDWMRQHLAHKDGALGLARKDTKTAQQAAQDIGRYRSRVEKAKPADLPVLEEEMRNYAFREFGMTERTLGIKDAQGLLNLLDEQAGRLASDVYQTWDAPEELQAVLAQIDAEGYKLVLGSHIGHLWDSTLPSMPDLRGAIGWRRKVAGVLGVDPTQVVSREAGRDATLRVTRHVDVAMSDPRFRAPPRVTAETIMQVLRDEKIVEPELRLPEHVATAVTRPFHRKGIERIQTEQHVDFAEAKRIYDQGMAAPLQLRDLSRAKFIKALTTPKTGVGPHGEWEWVGLDKQSANLVRRAVLRGYAERPGYIQGLATLEDWARGGFSFPGKLGGHISPAYRFAGDNGLAELVQRAAELPNTLVNLRNRLRFTLSPFFDFRRVAKQNVKMGIDGVTPVLNPLAHMIDEGTFDKAHKLLNRLIGDPAYAGFDDADRYLHQQSVWGLYNSRHFEAYYAWDRKTAGWTDEEIRQGIRRVFEYGSTRNEGRSALERSVNTIFFPFSFEKTLLRNVGAHMIDHPQQALLLTGAITAYDEANQHWHIHEWMQEHIPVLRDIEKLNAFAHGISPGELGGINAPLMNLFLPQQWEGGFTKENLQRFLPVWNDFGKLLHDVREQGVIGKNAALNLGDRIITANAPRDPLDPYRPTVTPEAQQRKAYAMRNQAIIAWTPILDYNLHKSSDAEKYTFPDDPRLPTSVRGKVVNRTTIGELVKVWYPAYNPGAARTYAMEQAEKATAYVDNLDDPVKRQQYGVFVKLADVVRGHLQSGDYDTPTSVAVMTQFRTVAAAASTADPRFYSFYNAHYRWLFGPLEGVTV